MSIGTDPANELESLRRFRSRKVNEAAAYNTRNYQYSGNERRKLIERIETTCQLDVYLVAQQS